MKRIIKLPTVDAWIKDATPITKLRRRSPASTRPGQAVANALRSLPIPRLNTKCAAVRCSDRFFGTSDAHFRYNWRACF